MEYLFIQAPQILKDLIEKDGLYPRDLKSFLLHPGYDDFDSIDRVVDRGTQLKLFDPDIHRSGVLFPLQVEIMKEAWEKKGIGIDPGRLNEFIEDTRDLAFDEGFFLREKLISEIEPPSGEDRHAGRRERGEEMCEKEGEARSLPVVLLDPKLIESSIADVKVFIRDYLLNIYNENLSRRIAPPVFNSLVRFYEDIIDSLEQDMLIEGKEVLFSSLADMGRKNMARLDEEQKSALSRLVNQRGEEDVLSHVQNTVLRSFLLMFSSAEVMQFSIWLRGVCDENRIGIAEQDNIYKHLENHLATYFYYYKMFGDSLFDELFVKNDLLDEMTRKYKLPGEFKRAFKEFLLDRRYEAFPRFDLGSEEMIFAGVGGITNPDVLHCSFVLDHKQIKMLVILKDPATGNRSGRYLKIAELLGSISDKKCAEVKSIKGSVAVRDEKGGEDTPAIKDYKIILFNYDYFKSILNQPNLKRSVMEKMARTFFLKLIEKGYYCHESGDGWLNNLNDFFGIKEMPREEESRMKVARSLDRHIARKEKEILQGVMGLIFYDKSHDLKVARKCISDYAEEELFEFLNKVSSENKDISYLEACSRYVAGKLISSRQIKISMNEENVMLAATIIGRIGYKHQECESGIPSREGKYNISVELRLAAFKETLRKAGISGSLTMEQKADYLNIFLKRGEDGLLEYLRTTEAAGAPEG